MSKENREAILEVTQEDYDRMVAEGITDETLLPVGKHVLRRVSPDRVATREDLHPSNTKVQITIKLDLDVLNYFKERAAAPHSAPYQTQINNELRGIMRHEEKIAGKNIKEELLEDKNFISALAEEIKKVA